MWNQMSYHTLYVPYLPFTNHTLPNERYFNNHQKIYDPLGLLSPVTIRAKILMQVLWKDKYNWDVPLPVDIQSTWTDLAKDIETATEIQIPRYYFSELSDEIGEMTLHIFTDASPKAYGACAYICQENQSRLVMAKNRVSPIKTLTLPQLELMGAVVGAHLANHLQSSFQVKETFFWTDSQIVLYWLTSTKPLKRFVSNRVKEIHNITHSQEWKYCPTNDNPADLLTRGIPATKFKVSQLWMNGPDWLIDNNKWPIWNRPNENTITLSTLTDKALSEYRPTHVKSTQNVSEDEYPGIHRLIDV